MSELRHILLISIKFIILCVMSCITILLEVTAMNTTIFAFQNYHHSPKMHAILLAQTANKKLELEAYLEWNWDHSLHQLARHTVRRSTHFRLSAVRDLFPPGVYQHCSRPISPDLGVLWSLLCPDCEICQADEFCFRRYSPCCLIFFPRAGCLQRLTN